MTQAESQTIDLLNAISDQPVTATWDGLEVVGVKGANTYPDELKEGGFLKDYDFTFLTSLKTYNGSTFINRFTTAPANGDQFIFDSITYEVKNVTLDDLGVGIQLAFENAAK